MKTTYLDGTPVTLEGEAKFLGLIFDLFTFNMPNILRLKDLALMKIVPNSKCVGDQTIFPSPPLNWTMAPLFMVEPLRVIQGNSLANSPVGSRPYTYSIY